jgi:hypothetical protein
MLDGRRTYQRSIAAQDEQRCASTPRAELPYYSPKQKRTRIMPCSGRTSNSRSAEPSASAPNWSMKASAFAQIAAHFAGKRYRHGEACSDKRSISSRQEATAGGRSDMPAS